MSDTDTLGLVRKALCEVAPNRAEEFEEVSADDTIEDLALDSIATMEMVGVLEDATGKTFPDEELAKVSTIADLMSLVQHGRLGA